MRPCLKYLCYLTLGAVVKISEWWSKRIEEGAGQVVLVLYIILTLTRWRTETSSNLRLTQLQCTSLQLPSADIQQSMDEGTIETPIPKCRLYWCFCLGWCGVAILQVLNLVRNRVLNSCRIWSTTQLNTPPPTATHCLYILQVYFGTGGGVGEVREKVEGQQFTRGVENTNMTDCISSLKTL